MRASTPRPFRSETDESTSPCARRRRPNPRRRRVGRHPSYPPRNDRDRARRRPRRPIPRDDRPDRAKRRRKSFSIAPPHPSASEPSRDARASPRAPARVVPRFPARRRARWMSPSRSTSAASSARTPRASPRTHFPPSIPRSPTGRARSRDGRDGHFPRECHPTRRPRDPVATRLARVRDARATSRRRVDARESMNEREDAPCARSTRAHANASERAVTL